MYSVLSTSNFVRVKKIKFYHLNLLSLSISICTFVYCSHSFIFVWAITTILLFTLVNTQFCSSEIRSSFHATFHGASSLLYCFRLREELLPWILFSATRLVLKLHHLKRDQEVKKPRSVIKKLKNLGAPPSLIASSFLIYVFLT